MGFVFAHALVPVCVCERVYVHVPSVPYSLETVLQFNLKFTLAATPWLWLMVTQRCG